MIYHFLTLFLILSTPSSEPSDSIGAISMCIYQRGKEIKPDDMGVYTLKKEPFALRWNDYRYDNGDSIIHACAVTFPASDSIFLELSPDMEAESSGCFAPGMGMAGYNDRPYEEIFIKDEACHYIWYQDSTDRRADLISEKKKVLTLEWPITHVRDQSSETSYPVQELKQDILNMAAYSELNHNGIIDEAELKKFVLYFEK
jgi:hypothetical protein